MNNKLANLSPEQRQAMLEAAAEARKEKKAWAEEHLDLEWGTDENVWRDLCSKLGFRMPNRYTSNQETRYIKRLFKHVDVDIQEYLDDCGVKTVKQLVALNPTYPVFAEIGFALEHLNEHYLEKFVKGV